MTQRSENRRHLEARLETLERKLDNLKWMMGTQTILLTILMLTYLLSLARWLVVFLLVAVPLLVIYRHRIPSFARRFGNLLGMIGRRPAEPMRDTSSRSKSSV
jgi:hypothetical protein